MLSFGCNQNKVISTELTCVFTSGWMHSFICGKKKINKCSLELNLGTQKCCLPCRGGRAVSPSGSCTSPVMEHQLPCSGDGAPSS